MLIGCNRNIKKNQAIMMHIYVKPNQDSVFCFFLIIFFTCTFFFFEKLPAIISMNYPWERERERERERIFFSFAPDRGPFWRTQLHWSFTKMLTQMEKKRAFLFLSKSDVFFFFFFSLAHKTSSNNKQITVITQLSAYTNLKLNIKSLKIINQTQDKADKPQAKNEKKKNP